MTYLGHVSNGQILLDEPARLPEGALVKVDLVEVPREAQGPRQPRARHFQPIEMPGESLAEELVRDRIRRRW